MFRPFDTLRHRVAEARSADSLFLHRCCLRKLQRVSSEMQRRSSIQHKSTQLLSPSGFSFHRS